RPHPRLHPFPYTTLFRSGSGPRSPPTTRPGAAVSRCRSRTARAPAPAIWSWWAATAPRRPSPTGGCPAGTAGRTPWWPAPPSAPRRAPATRSAPPRASTWSPCGPADTAPPGSLQQAGEPAVGERLAAGLAGGAVLQRRVAEGHLADGVAAHRARLAGAAVDPQTALLLRLQPARRDPPGALHRLGEGGAQRLVQAGRLPRREGAGRLERGHAGRGQDLVAVGVADARDQALVAQRSLQLPPLPREQPGQALLVEVVGERVGAQARDARHVRRIGHHVHREPLLGPGLGEVEARTGLQGHAQRQRPLPGPGRAAGQGVAPVQPAR